MAPLVLGIDFIARRQKQKAELDELRQKLDLLKKEKRRLRHELASEKLEYLLTTTFDPKTHAPTEMLERQRQISSQAPVITLVRSIRQILATYQLTGCTIFIYKSIYLGIRLDPFYNRRYYEPYYIIMDGSTIRWTSLPGFIATTSDMQTLLLPDRLDVLIRAFQEAVLAYIARREQLQEFKDNVRDPGVEIKAIGTTGAGLKITCDLINVASYQIDLRYQDTRSIYPTKVKVSRQVDQSIRDQMEKQGDSIYWDPQETERIINAFTTKKLLQAYQSIF